MNKLRNGKTLGTTVVIAALALAGCGGSGGSGAPKPPSQVATKAPAVGSVGIGDALVSSASKGAGVPSTGFLQKLPQPSGVGSTQAVCASAAAAPSGANIRRVSSAILCLLNAQRAARGLTPLKLNRKLTRAAIGHSRNMVGKHYFAHEGPDGNPVSRIKRARYIPRFGFWTVGENLAFGTGTAASPSQIMTAWMNSPEHKANILTAAFREIGIGIVPKAPNAGGPGATFTTDFGGIRKH